MIKTFRPKLKDHLTLFIIWLAPVSMVAILILVKILWMWKIKPNDSWAVFFEMIFSIGLSYVLLRHMILFAGGIKISESALIYGYLRRKVIISDILSIKQIHESLGRSWARYLVIKRSHGIDKVNIPFWSRDMMVDFLSELQRINPSIKFSDNLSVYLRYKNETS